MDLHKDKELVVNALNNEIDKAYEVMSAFSKKHHLSKKFKNMKETLANKIKAARDRWHAAKVEVKIDVDMIPNY